MTAIAEAPAFRTNSASERRLRLIIESAPVALTVMKPSGAVVAANHMALGVFGVESLEGLVGQNLQTLVAADDRDRFAAFIADVCRDGAASLEFEVVRSNGSRRVLETRGVPIGTASDGATVFLGATSDVTERRRLADECARLERSLQAERTRSATVLAEREEWRSKAGDILGVWKGAVAQAQRLLDGSGDGDPVLPDTPPDTDAIEVDSWEF